MLRRTDPVEAEVQSGLELICFDCIEWTAKTPEKLIGVNYVIRLLCEADHIDRRSGSEEGPSRNAPKRARMDATMNW